MKNNTLLYNLGTDVVAFTTRRCLGRNRERICELLNVSDSHLIIPHQTHGTDIRIIDEQLQKETPECKKDILEGVDAVITNLRGVCIGVSTADCIPVILYDQQCGVIAAAHAGWRGTVGRIVEKTLSTMTSTYGTKPENVVAAIGPGISLDSFEIGDEVYAEFDNAGFDMQYIAVRYPDSKDPAREKWHINLPLCNKLQLMNCGVKEDNVFVSDIDTYTNTDQFFSARIEQKGPEKCGRNFNAIMML